MQHRLGDVRHELRRPDDVVSGHDGVSRIGRNRADQREFGYFLVHTHNECACRVEFRVGKSLTELHQRIG